MLINETKNDVDMNLRAAMHMGGKLRPIFLIVGIFILLCGAVVLTLELLPSESGEEPDLFNGILCLVLGAVFCFLFFFHKLLIRKILKKNLQGKEWLMRYTFTEEGYSQEALLNDGSTNSTTTGSYGALTECKEYVDMWLLYLNKSTVYGVDKSGMKEGTAEELTALLMRQLGVRYKTCYKRKEK